MIEFTSNSIQAWNFLSGKGFNSISLIGLLMLSISFLLSFVSLYLSNDFFHFIYVVKFIDIKLLIFP